MRILVEERKRREIDPTLTKLRELQMSRERMEGDDYANQRIEELTQLIELLTGWYDDMNGLDTDRLVQLLSLGARVTDLMNKAGNVLPMRRRKGGPAEKDGSST